MKRYTWHGFTYQIDEKDLHLYPGAVPVEPEKKPEPETKKKTPQNKARRASNK